MNKDERQRLKDEFTRLEAEAQEVKRRNLEERRLKDRIAVRRLDLLDRVENNDLDKRLRQVDYQTPTTTETNNLFGDSYKPMDIMKFLR
jgi:hypothetical protein